MKKKLLIYFAFVVGLLFWGGNVYASNSIEAYMNNRDNQFISTGYRVAFQGQQTFIIDLFATDSLDNYFVLTMCTDSNQITSWSGVPSTDEFNIYTTKVSCMFPNSSYTGGHITYIYGSTQWPGLSNSGYISGGACSVNLANCSITYNITYTQPNQSSWALLYSNLSSTPFTIDYATDSLMNQNQTIIDSQGRIESGLLNTYNNITNQATNIINNNNTNAQAIINNVNDNSTQSEQELTGFLATWNSFLPTNGVVSSLFLLPVNFLNAFIGNFNNTCQPFNLGSLYGHNITFPCIDIQSIVGSNLYMAIDLLFCGLMIFAMIKKLILIWYEITSFKANAIYELYGGGK